MAEHTWRTVGTVDPLSLAETRIMSHHAVQWLQSVARSFVPPHGDDGHTNLGWHFGQEAFLTHDIPSSHGPIQFGLRLADLTLVELRNGAEWADLPLDGQGQAEIRAWILHRLEDAGLPSAQFSTDSPWVDQMPPHPVASGSTYGLATHEAPLKEFCNYFHNAALVLERVRARYTDISPGPDPVRTWPHHYDIAFLISLEEGDFNTARAVGAGFCPGDKAYDQPYFFTYPWPRSNRPADLPPLVAPGEWTRDDVFFGTVVTGEALKEIANQEAAVESYLIDAIEKCRAIALKG